MLSLLDPDIAKVELPLSEKIARRVATLEPFAKEYKFDAYKAALGSITCSGLL